jgi:Tfp pilus assembly protein PilO
MDAAGIGVCLLLSLAGYVMLVGPFLQQRAATAGLRREMEAQQDKAAELASAVVRARERLAAVREQLAASAIQLESAAHINKRIAALTEFFSRCDLHIDDVQTGRVCSGLQYDVVPITIVGRGAYPQCAKLLRGLCSQYPDMSMMRIDLAGSPVERPEAEKFRFELFWYAASGHAAPRAAGQTEFRWGLAL